MNGEYREKFRWSRWSAAARFVVDGLLVPFGLTRKPHILVACMPKSGSTFLATALASYPSLRRATTIPAWGRREQELSRTRLSRYNSRSYVTQLHLRNSAWTQHLIKVYHITPVVLVRNLADITVSLRDHLRRESTVGPAAFFTERHKNLPDDELEACIVRLALSWYLNFYASWRQGPKGMVFFYEDVVAAPEDAVGRILGAAGVRVDAALVEKAVESALHGHNRFNVGVKGRGEFLAKGAAVALSQLLDLYPEMEGDRLFIDTRKSLQSAIGNAR